jgi:acyl-CoA reductase-like NAD-dependent aldehyde dehydrogenase
MTLQTKLMIGGEFVDALDCRTMDVVNPFDGAVITPVAEAGPADIDRAVSAAGDAFPAWRALSAAQRGRLLGKLADAIEDNGEELARLESLDTGHPFRDTLGLDVPRTAATFRYFAGMADKYQGSVVPVESGFLNYVMREPIGVVGQIVPWNFPLMFTSWKLGPALAAGNTVVMKPAEITPLSTLKIGELLTQVGFPPGVVNLVPGYGQRAGQHLAEHPHVGKIAFTGSAGNLKRVQLELGGKGANIVFADADIPAAINGSAFAIFHNQGQACIAGSRLLLQESIADQFLEEFLKLAASIRLGDPMDTRTEMGPLTSQRQQQSVLTYCEVARQQGAEVLLGGFKPSAPELSRGFFVEPTVVRADEDARVNHEEVFGPFLSVTTFRDDADAIRIANSTQYGLGAGLWTADLARAHRVAGAIRAGMVWINCYKRVNPGSPFGGIGSSGYGREMGFEAMHDYTEAKSIWVNVDAQTPAHYARP